MITKNELAENIYNTISIYKNIFKNFQSDKMKKIKEDLSNNGNKVIPSITNLLSEFYLENELLSIVSNDKNQSIKNLELGLNDMETLNEIEYLVGGTIEMFTPLTEIDDTVLFFYEKVSKDICKEVIVEKYDNDYLKYWDLYVLIKNLEESIIKYRKAITG